MGGGQRDKMNAGEFSNKLGREGKRGVHVIMQFEKEGDHCLGTSSRQDSRKLESKWNKITI